MTAPTTAQVRAWLAELPDLCALLPDALVTRTAGQRTSRPGLHPKPPIRLDILALMETRDLRDANTKAPRCERPLQWVDGMWRCDPDGQGVLPWLWGWARDMESCAYDDRPTLATELPEDVTVASLCRWMMQGDLLDWYEQTQRQWGEFAIDLRRVLDAVRQATVHVRDAPPVVVPCGRCGEALTQQKPGLWECEQGHMTSVQAVTVNRGAKIIGIRADALGKLVRQPGPGVEPARPILGDGGSRRLYDLNDLRRVVTFSQQADKEGEAC